MTKGFMQFLSLLVLLISASCSGLPVYQSKQLKHSNEGEMLRYYKKTVKYDVFNDQDRLVVKMETAHPLTQMKIIEYGFTTWINKEGKKSRKNGVHYPLEQMVSLEQVKPSAEQIKKSQQASDEVYTDKMYTRMQQQFKTAPEIMKVTGFDQQEGETTYNLVKDDPDIEVDIRFDSNRVMHYTLSIPFDKLYTEASDGSRSIAVGLVSGSMDAPDTDTDSQGGSGGGGAGGARGMGGSPAGMQGGMGRRSAGGMGRPPGGMRSQSGNASGNKQMEMMAEPVQVWFKAELKE